MRILLSIITLGWLVAEPLEAVESIDFTRDVYPILADKCFHCHGPDANTREAGLRLDTKEGAFSQKKNRKMLVAGKSTESEVIRRILSEDAGEVMPPPESNRSLTAQQKATLKRWVDEGAKWGTHWSFVPLPKVVSIPKPKVAWGSTPIDAFISARLEKEGLQPSPEATREAWLRRVSLDLTGLPPTIAEIDAFIKDTSPNAYEKVVDRLLNSKRYGERMASEWLDVARYADTHGYQMDRDRPMWPYRDWVIQSFNRNQRFDEFLTWQLAGDLLPKATQEQRLATAFNRLHMQNEEGGIVEEEFRVAYVVDRVNTMGTAFLGMTFECSRCHDHKYDPITMKDYYSLFAYFQNIDESGQTTYFTSAMPVPTLWLTGPQEEEGIEQRRRKLRELEARREALRKDPETRKAFEEWRKNRPAIDAKSGLAAEYTFDDWKGNTVNNSVKGGKPGNVHDNARAVPGKIGNGATLSGENGFIFPGIGHFSRSTPFSLSIWVNTPNHPKRAVVVHHSKAPVDAGSRGYELLIEDGRIAFGLHHMWPGNSAKVSTKAKLSINTWTHVAVTYDGSSTAKGMRIFLDGVPVEVDIIRDKLRKDITYENGEPNLAIGYRFRDNGFKAGMVDEFRVYHRDLTPLEIAAIAGAKVEATDADLEAYFLARVHTPMMQLTAELNAARTDFAAFVNKLPEVMVMEELPTPKPAFILKRGAYDSPGDPVTMNTPASLPGMPADFPKNRLGLAMWLILPDHPLTARVTVNRLWQQMFGRGLVETSDNFGTTGIPPTHPELLDWLARDFIQHEWDVKRFLKQIALSTTYRQSAKVTPELLAKDPYNLLLARMPVRRLSAEMLRDQALFVSGMLVERIGGASVYPYQPDGLWNEAMGRPSYPRSRGANLYRRSLYTYWKRTAPHPQMTIFDAADRSVCTARRQTTSTPLQALALLNDPQMIEAARFLGQRMLLEGGTQRSEQVAWAFRTVTGRAPTDKERAVLVKIYEEQLAEFAANPKDAEKLLLVGDSKNDAALKPVELAGAASLALALLNHDAAVVRR